MKTTDLLNVVVFLTVLVLLAAIVRPACGAIIFGDSGTYEPELDWARAANGSVGLSTICGWNNHVSITFDAEGGIYASDSFIGPVELVPGDEESRLTSEENGMFIAKYSPSGYLVWALGLNGWYDPAGPSGSGRGEVYDSQIAVDSDKNIYATGAFGGSIDFDPTEGRYSLTGERDGMFMAEYDRCGNLVWAFAINGIRDSQIAVDSQKNIYLTGTFYGAIDFDPGEGTYNLTSQGYGMFIAKYDSSGNFLWARAVSAWREELDGSGEIKDSRIAVDSDQNVHVTGTFFGTLDFDPGDGTYYLTSEQEGMFIAKYDQAGDFLWARAVSGWHSGEIDDSQIAVNIDKNTYVTGTFFGTLDFDPGEGTYDLTSERYGMFIAKYDQAGNLLWAHAVSAWYERVSPWSYRWGKVEDSQIAVDIDTNVYVAGIFHGTLDFDPTDEEHNLTSEKQGMFMAKYDDAGNFLWADAVIGRSEDGGRGGYARDEIKDAKIACDGSGNICVAGTFDGTVDFGPGQHQYDLTGSGMFAAKYRTRSEVLNCPPIADAGSDQTVYSSIDSKAEVTLNGIASYDDDCDMLTYLWIWTVDGNTYEVNGVSPTIKLPVGQHLIELFVNDGLDTSEPDEVVITILPSVTAEVEMVPRTLNLKSEGKWIVCKIRLGEDYDVGEIEGDSVLLEYEVEAESVWIDGGGGVAVARFGRQDVQEILETGEEVEVVVSGELVDGRRFEGIDVITVIDRGSGKSGK